MRPSNPFYISLLRVLVVEEALRGQHIDLVLDDRREHFSRKSSTLGRVHLGSSTAPASVGSTGRLPSSASLELKKKGTFLFSICVTYSWASFHLWMSIILPFSSCSTSPAMKVIGWWKAIWTMSLLEALCLLNSLHLYTIHSVIATGKRIAAISSSAPVQLLASPSSSCLLF